ncbi:MAG: hypothetical protein QOG71_3033 [Pyrinomonadaceae bacterium]|nr:hypothetical protein [Pyrinomonadaceae bacterium]
MIQQAYVSGQLGRVIYTKDDRYFLLQIERLEEPVECRPMDLSTFFNYGAEITTFSGAQLDLAQLKNQLITQRQAYRALAMVISGLDEELDQESRQTAIEAAESLFRDAPTLRFVRARMLSRPLPAEADIEVARDIAIRLEATSVGFLYQNALDCGQAICLVYETWLEAAPEYFASQEERVEGERLLLELGVFADMAQALTRRDATALSSIIITYGQHPELNSKLKQSVLILNDLRTRLSNKWDFPSTGREDHKRKRRASGDTEHVADDGDPVHEILARFRQRREHPRSRTLSADEAKEKVDHQIEAIGKLIRHGNIGRADRFLRDLINFHVEHSEREHLGMSLCALSKVAIDTSAFQLAEQMVNYALMLGIDDVVISNTQAETFKAMGRFDNALAVYRETIERFPNNEVARSGYAEVLKATGRFDDALAVYRETIERFPNDEVARNGYAEVLKATGRFDDALAAYEEAMARFPNNEVARNGYADVLKAMGRFDDALAVYQETIERFPNNEVARNGYAEVLKATGRFDDALAVYRETIERFPNNEVARSGYAEVLKATGRFDDALAAYEEAMARFPNDEVARNGYAEVLKATGRFDDALAVYRETIERFPNNEVARSGYASVLMLMNRFAEVPALLSGTRLSSKGDWIAYHIVAMSYLRSGEIDEAIRRLDYGFHNNPWITDRFYFASALALAKIKKRQFDEVLEVLPTNVTGLDVFQKQTRLVLVGHSQAALGMKEEAAETLAQLEQAANPRVINLKEAITRRYDLKRQSSASLSPDEEELLEAKIQEEEFFLALAA